MAFTFRRTVCLLRQRCRMPPQTSQSTDQPTDFRSSVGLELEAYPRLWIECLESEHSLGYFGSRLSICFLGRLAFSLPLLRLLILWRFKVGNVVFGCDSGLRFQSQTAITLHEWEGDLHTVVGRACNNSDDWRCHSSLVLKDTIVFRCVVAARSSQGKVH